MSAMLQPDYLRVDRPERHQHEPDPGTASGEGHHVLEAHMEQVQPDAEEHTFSSQMLEDLLDQAPTDYFTLGWLMSALHQRSFGIIMLLLGVLAAIPVGSTVPAL